MKKQEKNNDLGKGIIIGLIYGLGAFLMAWFKNFKGIIVGLMIFSVAYYVHRWRLEELKGDKLNE